MEYHVITKHSVDAVDYVDEHIRVLYPCYPNGFYNAASWQQAREMFYAEHPEIDRAETPIKVRRWNS